MSITIKGICACSGFRVNMNQIRIKLEAQKNIRKVLVSIQKSSQILLWMLSLKKQGLDVNILGQRLSIFSCKLSLIGVWLYPIFLVFPFMFYLIVVILVFDLCPHSTSPMYSGWLFFFFFFEEIILYYPKLYTKLHFTP